MDLRAFGLLHFPYKNARVNPAPNMARGSYPFSCSKPISEIAFPEFKIVYSASRRAAMSRASISLCTRVISSDFRSMAANTLLTKGESVTLSFPAILAGGLGRAGGRFFGKPLACLDNLARNSNPK